MPGVQSGGEGRPLCLLCLQDQLCTAVTSRKTASEILAVLQHANVGAVGVKELQMRAQEVLVLTYARDYSDVYTTFHQEVVP